MSLLDVRKYGARVTVSRELLEDSSIDLYALIQAQMNATPEQRAQWAREAAERRARRRAAAQPAALTLDALLDKLGWSREYAEHVVQSYCGCEDDIDGWTVCDHARDLGVER